MRHPAEASFRARRCWPLRTLLVLVGSLFAGAGVQGDVIAHGEGGFQLRSSVSIAAPVAAVFEALTGRIGSWWDGAHTYGGNASALSIDPSPGGCFCETLSGGEVQHLTVSFVDQDRELRLLGGLGPLQALGATGAMRFALTEAGAGTRLDVTYNVTGFFPDGSADWAGAVDRVVAEQVHRLKAYAEDSEGATGMGS